MCGEHCLSERVGGCVPGSSPHVRGAPTCRLGVTAGNGIIPACAGSTVSRVSVLPYIWDHPRMCGEHLTEPVSNIGLSGSSPHVRGALATIRCTPELIGIIPACAGSTESVSLQRNSTRDHPRMCGEHFMLMVGIVHRLGSSPHVRGALLSILFLSAVAGIIPACAGSTLLLSRRLVLWRDHPRMCGEHTSKIA